MQVNYQANYLFFQLAFFAAPGFFRLEKRLSSQSSICSNYIEDLIEKLFKWKLIEKQIAKVG